MLTRETFTANLNAIEARITGACQRAGRPRSSVQLVAVSKLHPVDSVRLAWETGHRHFGENYAQELRDKHEALSDCAGVVWHAIGPVQPKNAKYLARAAHWFHALNRLEVAQELSKRRTGAALRCLVEVNVAGERTKAGLPPGEVEPLIAAVRRLPGLEVVGLSAMPPLVEEESAERNREHFLRTAELASALGLPELSMGTSGDFEVAIEAGSTLVRVGTALFGARLPH